MERKTVFMFFWIGKRVLSKAGGSAANRDAERRERKKDTEERKYVEKGGGKYIGGEERGEGKKAEERL